MEGVLRHLEGIQWGTRVQQLIPYLNGLLVVLLAYVLAGLTWRVWVSLNDTESGTFISSPVVVKTASSLKPAASDSLETVSSLHLFGKAEVNKSEPVKNVIDAPETRLSLSLKGIFATSEAGQGLALIAEGKSQEQLYHVGDALTGGAVLHEVLADKVILKRGGRFETLTLPREMIGKDKKASTGTSSAPSTKRTGRVSAVSHQLKLMRDKIAEDPTQALNLIQASPVMENGTMKGYQVRPGKQRSLFTGTGLRSGDVVTSVNGIELSDMSQMGALFSKFKSSDTFNITVERGGRARQLTIDLTK